MIEGVLRNFDLDMTSKLGGSLQFFIYDVIKITILLCVLIFIISYVQNYFLPGRSKKTLRRFDGLEASIISALLGIATPFCSCPSIPIFMGFTGTGLPIGVSFSFLIFSPMVDLGSPVLLMSILGGKIALAYVILGLVITVVGGSLIEKMHIERYAEDFIKNTNQVDTNSPSLTLKNRADFSETQVSDMFKKVFPHILVGVGTESLIHNWIPQIWVENILGNKNPFRVVLATFVGVSIYTDIFGSIPIAGALSAKGTQLGTVLSFVMAVATLSLPSLIMLKKAAKPRLLFLFIGICVFGITVVGYLSNISSPILVQWGSKMKVFRRKQRIYVLVKTVVWTKEEKSEIIW